MEKEYTESLNELYKGNAKIVSMAFVELWLLKYSDLYKSRPRSLPYLDGFDDKDGRYAFSDTYFGLEQLSEDHLFESNCKIALVEFEKIESKIFSNDNTQLLDWILRHEKLGVENVIQFGAGYYYPEDDSPTDLSVSKVKLKVSKTDFSNIISFLELFNGLYWGNHDAIAEMFPTSLAAAQIMRTKNSNSEMVSGDNPPF